MPGGILTLWLGKPVRRAEETGSRSQSKGAVGTATALGPSLGVAGPTSPSLVSPSCSGARNTTGPGLPSVRFVEHRAQDGTRNHGSGTP